jgi:hypothetical protein
VGVVARVMALPGDGGASPQPSQIRRTTVLCCTWESYLK